MPFWINYRDEMQALIQGDRRTVAQGRWGVIRIMRIGEYSRYWNNKRKEAIGGPKWLYDDCRVRYISKPGGSMSVSADSAGSFTDLDGLGTEDVNSMIFAVEYNKEITRVPNEADLIYEISEYEGITPPIPPLHVTDRFKIIHAFPEHGDNGRIEIIYLLGTRIHGEK